MSLFQFRYVISLMILGSILAPYIGRLNLAIAIVYMAKSQKVLEINVTQIDVCPVDVGVKQEVYHISQFKDDDQRFNWDETTQGHILR